MDLHFPAPHTIMESCEFVRHNTPRLESIDVLKGLLMVTVVVGHVIPFPVGENILRRWIYFFHMPLFFAVSGYLVNGKKLIEYNWPAFCMHYWRRMLMPWGVAMVIYSAFAICMAAVQGRSVVKEVVYTIMFPYYHLWFVPALFIMLSMTRLMEVYRVNRWLVLLGASAFSLFWLVLNANNVKGDGWLRFMGDKRVFYMFAFFYLPFAFKEGHLLNGNRDRLWKFMIPFGVALTFICILIAPDTTLNDVAYWFVNLVLAAIFSFNIAELKVNGRSFSSLIWIGKNTLPIYLWHVLPIKIAAWIYPPAQELLAYYVTASIFILVVILAIRFMSVRSGSFLYKVIFGYVR